MDTDNSVVKARGKGQGLGGGGQRGRNGDICNSVNNKNKEKNFNVIAKKNKKNRPKTQGQSTVSTKHQTWERRDSLL